MLDQFVKIREMRHQSTGPIWSCRAWKRCEKKGIRIMWFVIFLHSFNTMYFGKSFSLYMYAWNLYLFCWICLIFINRYSKWNFRLTCLIIRLLEKIKLPNLLNPFNRQVTLNIQPTWILVSQPLTWTSCWRWVITSRSTISLVMPSTIWGTTRMDPALSIPWACPDWVQTWLSQIPTQRMSSGKFPI